MPSTTAYAPHSGPGRAGRPGVGSRKPTRWPQPAATSTPSVWRARSRRSHGIGLIVAPLQRDHTSTALCTNRTHATAGRCTAHGAHSMTNVRASSSDYARLGPFLARSPGEHDHCARSIPRARAPANVEPMADPRDRRTTRSSDRSCGRKLAEGAARLWQSHDDMPKSIVFPRMRSLNRPSCGTRFSAMSSSAMTLMREMIGPWKRLSIGRIAACRTPSIRYFT